MSFFFFCKLLSNVLSSNTGCQISYAAGVTWGVNRGPVFEGEIERFPCTDASSEFRYVCIIHLSQFNVLNIMY